MSNNSLVQDLIEAGIHFGQRSSNWNPKMGPYIYGKRSGIHIIDIKETVKGLLLAKRLVTKMVSDGKDICFVGTKRQAKGVIEQRVADVKMHYVTERWLGGTLTNFRTIRARLKRLEELEAIEADDNFQSYSKKMESQLRREMRKIKRNLDGIRGMDKLPGALVIVDANQHHGHLGFQDGIALIDPPFVPVRRGDATAALVEVGEDEPHEHDGVGGREGGVLF